MRLQVYHAPNKNEIRALKKQFFNIITTDRNHRHTTGHTSNEKDRINSQIDQSYAPIH